MQQESGTLTGVIADLEASAENTQGGTNSVGDLIDALDQRGYGAVLAILPLIELTPLGGIPGFPTALALTLAVVTIRMVLGYEHLWMPSWIRDRRLKSDKVLRSLEWLKPLSSRVDATLHERLSWFADPVAQRAACIVILLLLLTVPPLELVPFATSGPMVVIAFFGLGLLYRDGLLMLVGFVGAIMAVAGGLWGAKFLVGS